jgi:uncharacterized membrane protein
MRAARDAVRERRLEKEALFMDLTPLVTAPPAVQWHVATILPAAVLGAVQLSRRKGIASHRVLGYLFVALMLGTCVSAYFIRTPAGGFSWIHIFIPATIVELALGFWFLWRGNIRGHQVMMLFICIASIGIAGALTFLPGRIMQQIFFGG